MLVGSVEEKLADADVVDQQSVVVDDVDDVERFAVLAVRADVFEHVRDGPVFLHAHVVRRHQTPDRALGVTEQLDRFRALFRREQGEELARRLRRELIEERRAIVGRHVVQERRRLVRRHRAQERVLFVGRQVGEGVGGGLPRQNAEDQDALLEREVGEHRGDVASRPVAQHVAEPAEIALADDRGDLVGRPHRVAHQLQRGIAVGTVQFVFHKYQRRAHHIVMVHARTNGPDDVEPEPVDVFEVLGAESGRVRAQVIRGGGAARVIDDEADVDAGRLARALPGVAQQPRLVVGRERFRFADVNLRRLQAQRGFDHRVEDVHAGHDHQPHGAPFALRGRDHGRQQAPLLVGRARILRGIVGNVHADEPHGHRHDVAIARRAQRADEVREHVRAADRHEEISGPHLHLPQIDIVGRQQLEFVERDAGPLGLGRDRSPRDDERDGQRRDQGEAGERGRIGDRGERAGREYQEGRRADQTDRPLASADRDVERHAVGALLGADRPVADERRQLEDRRHDDGDRIAARDP